MWCGDGRASCGGRWRGAHSAIFSLISGCATRPSRQKDGTSQVHGTSSSLQAQRVVILIVCHGEHRRLGQQGESSAAEARYNLCQQQRLHQRRSRLALQIRTAACATSWTGAATGTRVSTSATAAGDGGVRRSIFAVSTALVTIAAAFMESLPHFHFFSLLKNNKKKQCHPSRDPRVPRFLSLPQNCTAVPRRPPVDLPGFLGYKTSARKSLSSQSYGRYAV